MNNPKTLIIAEAGVNHNGNLQLAKKLIDVAAGAGVDFVKFQTFRAEKLVSSHAKKATYQVENMGNDTDDSQFEMLKKLELDIESHHILMDYCREKKISFLSSPFDMESIDLLNQLGLELFKIPSGEITNLPYLKKIGQLKKKVILSTGMSDMQEIADALNILQQAGTAKEDIIVLHCNTEYPTPMADVNLLAMQTIAKKFGVKTGYSDHTLGIEIPIAAVAMGAVCIEKHFTLDKNMQGPDHCASLDPSELKAMVQAIRNIELAMGDGLKKPSASELKNKTAARKSIHLANTIKKGEQIKEGDLIMKRPGNGISPMRLSEVIGKTVKENMKADMLLSFDDFEK